MSDIISDIKKLPFDHTKDWFYEGNISRKIVDYLKSKGYKILKDNSENCKARGEDIIAENLLGCKEIVEVKGYPSIYHVKGKSKGQTKPTDPKQQAKHWFSEALIACIFNYKKHRTAGNIILAVGFPKFDRYFELIDSAKDYFTDHNMNVKVYLIGEIGDVTVINLNTNIL